MSEEEKKTEEAQADAPTEEATPAAEAPKEEAPAEAPKEEAPAAEVPEVEVPKKFKKIVEEIEAMTVMELNELVKVFEDKFGVSATAVAAAGPAAGGDAGAGEEASEVNVKLVDAGGQKIAVIKAVKEVLGLGLKEAKDLVDGAPAMLKENMKKEDADALKAKIEEAGGKVEYA